MLEQEVQRNGAGQRGPAPRRALAGIRSEGLEVICQRGGGGGAGAERHVGNREFKAKALLVLHFSQKLIPGLGAGGQQS